RWFSARGQRYLDSKWRDHVRECGEYARRATYHRRMVDRYRWVTRYPWESGPSPLDERQEKYLRIAYDHARSGYRTLDFEVDADLRVMIVACELVLLQSHNLGLALISPRGSFAGRSAIEWAARVPQGGRLVGQYTRQLVLTYSRAAHYARLAAKYREA